MRIHRLEITGFGPFPGTEVIDFDELNDAGFFLLTGPTGAGKTSVLDAICFGLFGAVPGVRNNAKDLKSHHAGPRDQPVVELELTLRDRRLRLRRTPAWRRPSTRARSGFVDENASVVAAELVDGQWVSRGTRLDEVGLLVTRLIGMNKDQFCQVVMLPQGQFETFLRAGAKERHDVLEALFQTGRFQRIEKWLGEHRRRSETASRVHEDQLQLLLAKAEEVNGARWYDAEATTRAAATSLAAAIAERESLSDSLRSDLAAATSAAKAAEHAVSEAEQLQRRHEELAAAQRTLHELDSVQGAVDLRAVRVARARLADKVVPVLELLDLAAARHVVAAEAVAVTRSRAVACGALVDPDAAPGPAAQMIADSLRTQAARLRAELDIDASITALTTSITATEAALRTATADHAAAVDAMATIPALLSAARAELARASEQAAAIEALALRHANAVRIHQAAATVPALRAALAAAHDVERTRRDQQLDARSQWADIREARVAGMAAHLAGELRPGEDCPVCGGTEHPRPAVAGVGHVTETDEIAAHERREQADSLLTSARSALAEAERSLSETLRVCDGVDEPTARSAVTTAAAAVDDARAAADLASELSARIDALEAHQQSVQQSIVERTSLRDTVRVDLDHQRTSISGLIEKRAELLPDGGTIAAALELIDAQLGAIDDWQTAAAALRDADESLSGQRAGFARKLAASSFSDESDLRDAVMTAADIASAETLNRTHADQRAIALGRLDDPLLAAAAESEPPDIAALRSIADDAHRRHQTVADRYRQSSHRQERLVELSDALHDAVDAWTPLQEAADLAASVAAMCAGTSPDNQTRTRLSHYVLAARLQQVVDAANVRLLTISSGRYQLLHTMLKGVGDTRGGLGLRVLDTYTSHERDPATLSGGETFYVSLALALGLADLVRDEIGGAELSTLFVDEGFGSLDAETLDEVLDEIDSLRSGGRSVGLVSHLSELRRRIPTQIRIVSSQHGSTVSVD